jgi:hypothetical protein
MRTVLAGEAEGVCSGAGGGVTDSSGEIRGEGDSPGTVGEVGIGDSCAAATETKVATRNAKLILLVMSSEVETSRTLPKKYREIPPSLRIKLPRGKRLRAE